MSQKRVVSTSRRVDANKAGQQGQPDSEKRYVGTFEAEWTCSSCGRTPIPGSVKVCPSCAHPKDASETYQEPGQRGRYLTASELAQQGVDPAQHLSDETCEYCGAKIKPGTQICPHCNANLVEVGYTSRQCPTCQHETNEMTCPACGTATVMKGQKPVAAAPLPHPTAKPQSFFARLGVWGLFLAILVCGCLGLGAAIISQAVANRPQPVTVTDVYWKRTILLEEYKYNERGDWTLPPTADLISTEEAIHHYNDILTGYVEQCHTESQQVGSRQECGYEQSCQSVSVYDYTETVCYDDGTCDDHDVYTTEQQCSDEYVCEDVPNYQDVQVCEDVPQYIQEPVYQTYYTFNIWEWVIMDPVVAEGHDHNLYWPEVTTSDAVREQNNGRIETCTITVTDKDGYNSEYTVPCEEFGRYERGTMWERDYSGTLTPAAAEASEQ